MSEPQHPPDRIELETVVNWRMIAAGAGVGAIALGAAVVFLVLTASRTDPVKALALAPPAAAPSAERPVAPPPPRKSPTPPARTTPPASPVVAAPELLPPPVEKPEPPRRRPDRVAAMPAAPPSSEAVRKAEAPAPAASFFKRIHQYSESQLLYLLDREAKEVDLDVKDGPARKGSATAGAEKETPRWPAAGQTVLDLIARHDDLKGLPVRDSRECQCDPKVLPVMASISRELRRADSVRSRRSTSNQSFHVVMQRDKELASFVGEQKKWQTETAVPALVQMLGAESEAVRQQLVATLAAISGEKASAALAQRAVFDPSPAVREAAVKALGDRPREDYRPVLLGGLRYPWPPAASHAAEALVALDDQESVFALAGLLDEPDPAAPARDRDSGKWVATEVVRVNHLRNCMLCHAPSADRKDALRALVPEKGKPLPEVYYNSGSGTFVRADVTYLKQDFSVTLPVPDAAPWPSQQRFDCLTRKRELTDEEVARLPPAKDPRAVPLYPQRQAVLWALRQLTGQDVGEPSEGWNRALARWYMEMDW
jgi:outer membrane biosynthesis protein TonB